MNNKEPIASELAKVIDSWPRCYLNLLELFKNRLILVTLFSSLLTCKGNARLKQSLQILLKDRPKHSLKAAVNRPYVNFFLDKPRSLDQAPNVIEAGADYGQQRRRSYKHYHRPSSPKIAKPFSVGHLRQTLFSQTSFRKWLQHDSAMKTN